MSTPPILFSTLALLAGCATAADVEGAYSDEKGKPADFCETHVGHPKCPPVIADPVGVTNATFWADSFSENAGNGHVFLVMEPLTINGQSATTAPDAYVWLGASGGAPEISPNVFQGTGSFWIPCNTSGCTGDIFRDDAALIRYETAIQSTGLEAITTIRASGTESGVAYSLNVTRATLDGTVSDFDLELTR